MRHRFVCAAICTVVLAMSLVSCDTNSAYTALKLPTTATTPTSTVPPPPSPYGPATTIPLGQTSAGSVRANDAACKELDTAGYYYYPLSVPCQRFLVNAPQAGALTVHLEWANADNMLGLAGRVAPFGKLSPLKCCSSPLDQTYEVKAAGAFLIFVAWSANNSGQNLATAGAQDFQVTPTFTPFANAQLRGAK